MAKNLELHNEDELRAWLKDKPMDWAQVIAARSALRVFPIVFSVAHLSDWELRLELRQGLILSVWRANLLSWTACKYPAHDMRVCASTAAVAVGTTAKFVAATAAVGIEAVAAAKASENAAVAARAKANAIAIASARATASAAASAAEAAVRAVDLVPSYAATAGIVWEAVTADARLLAATKGAGSAAVNLISQPLWMAPITESKKYKTNSPEFSRRAFDRFANLDWVRSSPWQVMADWYVAILPNNKSGMSRSLYGQEADVEIAMQTEEFWSREPNEVMAGIVEIVERVKKRNEETSIIIDFIENFLNKKNIPVKVDEIFDEIAKSEHHFSNVIIPDLLNMLVKAGRILKVETGVYARNEWQFGVQEDLFNEAILVKDTADAIENLEPQAPAAFRFAWSGDKVVAQSPDAFTTNSDIAQDLLDDVRRKALFLAERLERSNAEKRVRDSIQGLIDILVERVAEMRPGLLRSRSRSIEADATAFSEPDAERELFPDAVAALTDLSETLRDLQGCFPELRDIEAEIVALDLNSDRAIDVKANLDEIVDAIYDHEDIVDQSAIDALQTMKGIASEDASPAVKQKRIAEYALVVRNFMSPLARFALDNAFSKAVTDTTREVWAKARPKLVDGIADGIGSMARPATIIAIATLIHLVVSPTAAVAAAAAGFGKIDRLLHLVEKWLLKSSETANEDEADKATDEDGN